MGRLAQDGIFFSFFFFVQTIKVEIYYVKEITYVSKVGLFDRFLWGWDVRGELGGQNGPATRYRTG